MGTPNMSAQSEWNKRNRATINKATLKWREANPDKVRAKNRINRGRFRARRAQVLIEPFTIAEWQAKVDSYAGRCAYCDTGLYEHQDHVVPLGRGGAHSLDNVVPACATCNCTKKNQTWTPRAPSC